MTPCLLYTQSQIDQELGVPDGWTTKDPDMCILMTQLNAVEKVRIPGSITNISENKQKVLIHAEKLEELLNTVILRATDIKMKVNTSKTQLLCVSSATTSEITSYINTGQEKIKSCNNLKILGFMFGPKPTVRPHIDNVMLKARKKLWTLRHLKRAGLGKEDMLRVCCANLWTHADERDVR